MFKKSTKRLTVLPPSSENSKVLFSLKDILRGGKKGNRATYSKANGSLSEKSVVR